MSAPYTSSCGAIVLTPARRFNLGRGRTIPANTGEFFVHRSVKTRMEHSEYVPKAENWAELEPVYVD